MRQGSILSTPLVIATMAFAVVAFLFLIDTSMNPAGNSQLTNSPINQNNNSTACTQEAKLCPDGSYVGRTGPNCAFAPCPSTNRNTNFTTNTNSSINTNSSDPTAEWKTYTNATYGYSIKYPAVWIVNSGNGQVTLSGTSATGTMFSTPMVVIKSKDTLYPNDSCLMSDATTTVANVIHPRQIEGCSYAGAEVATFFKTDKGYLLVSWTQDVPDSYQTYEEILSTLTLTN